MRADKLAGVKIEPNEIDYQDIGWEDWEPDCGPEPYSNIDLEMRKGKDMEAWGRVMSLIVKLGDPHEI